MSVMSLSNGTRFGILGGGFGLYGWLPAISSFSDQPIFLPARYQSTLVRRRELNGFLHRVRFVDHDDEVIAGSDALVCARRPQDQVLVVNRCVQLGWQGQFFLEKPLAPEPEIAFELLQTVERAGCGLSVGFTFRPTQWAARLTDWLSDPRMRHIQIAWRFLAHHYRHDVATWKKSHHLGGGSLRFFAIHFLPLLTGHGPWTVEEISPTAGQDDCRVSLTLFNGRCRVSLECDSRSDQEPTFHIQARGSQASLGEFQAGDPLQVPLTENDTHDACFQGQNSTSQDTRVRHLLALLKNAARRQTMMDPVVRQHIDLWQQLEQHRRQDCDSSDSLFRSAG